MLDTFAGIFGAGRNYYTVCAFINAILLEVLAISLVISLISAERNSNIHKQCFCSGVGMLCLQNNAYLVCRI